MNKKFKILGILTIFIAIFVLSGCSGRLVKNPRIISVKTDKGVATLTYDDNGLYQLNNLANNYFLQNEADNFSIFISSYTKEKKEHDENKNDFKNDKKAKYLDSIKINGYTGYGRITKENGNTELYIFLDNKNNIALCIRISAVNTKKIKKDEKHPENMLYNKKEIKEILNTLEYKNK